MASIEAESALPRKVVINRAAGGSGPVLIEASFLNASGAELATLRTVARFPSRGAVWASASFSAACNDVRCSPTETCVDGRCAPLEGLGSTDRFDTCFEPAVEADASTASDASIDPDVSVSTCDATQLPSSCAADGFLDCLPAGCEVLFGLVDGESEPLRVRVVPNARIRANRYVVDRVADLVAYYIRLAPGDPTRVEPQPLRAVLYSGRNDQSVPFALLHESENRSFTNSTDGWQLLQVSVPFVVPGASSVWLGFLPGAPSNTVNYLAENNIPPSETRLGNGQFDAATPAMWEPNENGIDVTQFRVAIVAIGTRR